MFLWSLRWRWSSRAQEGDKISLPASILSELLRKQAEIPWQFELKLVRRKAPGEFEPVDVPAPSREVRAVAASIRVGFLPLLRELRCRGEGGVPFVLWGRLPARFCALIWFPSRTHTGPCKGVVRRQRFRRNGKGCVRAPVMTGENVLCARPRTSCTCVGTYSRTTYLFGC